MSCIKEIEVKGKKVDSQLQPEILKIMKDNPHLVLDEVISHIDDSLESISELTEEHYEEVADMQYNYFTDSAFKEEFGDWQTEENLENTYSSGEPKLFFDKSLKKHFYRNKYNDKIYFPLKDNGLSYIYDIESIEEGVRYIAYKFFKNNFNNDYSDMSFLSDKSFEDSIRDIILSKINQYKNTDRDYIAEELEESLYYLDEWKDRVSNYFKSLNFEIHDEISESEEMDEESNSTQQLVRKASHEQSPKQGLSANIKAFLSFIPDYNTIDLVFEDNRFVEFEDIYNTLQTALSDISPTLVDANVEDTFNLMLDRISELAQRKPYMKELIKILNHPSLTEEKKSQFTQAFSLVKNPYFVTEIEFKKRGLNYSNKDVSEVNSTFNKVVREWGYNFEEKLLKGGKLDVEKVNSIIDNLKSLASEVNSLKDITDVNQIDSITNNLLDQLRELGIETTEQAFKSYLGLTEDFTIEIDELTSNIKSLIKSSFQFTKGLSKTKSFYDKNKILINPLKEESAFKSLAKEEAFFKPDGSDTTIFSSGKSYWVYSLPSHIQGEVNKWKSNLTELEDLYNSQWGSGSKILQYLLAYDSDYGSEEKRKQVAKKRVNEYKVGIFNALQDKKTQSKNSDAKGNTEVSKDDVIIDTINRALLFKKGDRSLFNTPTPADKSTAYLLSHGFYVETNITSLHDDDKGSRVVVPEHIVNIFYDYFVAEYDRMYKAGIEIKDKNAPKYVHYHTKKGKTYDSEGKLVGNAFKSQLFEALSFDKINNTLPGVKIYQDDGTAHLKSIEEYAPQIKEYIGTILSDNIADTMNRLYKSKILLKSKDSKDGWVLNGIDLAIASKYNNESELPSYNAVADFYINTLINNYEYSKMFSGDPAFYKDMVDYAKRIPATYTDGLQLRLLNNDDLTFNASIISGVEIGSKYMDDLVKVMGEDAKEFYGKGKINSTDAQAWITPKRWEFLVKRLGLWSKYHESAYPKMLGKSKEPFTEKELKAVAQPLKGVYFKVNNGVPTYLKYSQAVLLPDLIKGTDLERLYNEMTKDEDPSKHIDEVITLDGIKVGAVEPNTIHTEEGFLAEDFSLNSMTLDNRGWKLQQNLPTKTYKNTDVGSQIQKNVLAGLSFGNLDETFNVDGKELKGREVYRQLNSVVGALSDLGIKELTKELNIDDSGRIQDTKALYDLLIKEAEKRNVNDNLINALKKELSIYGIPQSHTKLLNMFFAITKDRLVKIKTNGGSFIQVSNFGIDRLTDSQKTGVKWLIDPEKGLKPPHIENNKVKPGQVLLPGSLLTPYIPNWKELPASKLKELIDSEILENVIGYRIPNQGLSSNDALEIVGFLPEGIGDAVVAYSEIPTKTGSDFDIDKMFMMIPSFKARYKFSNEDIEDIKKTFRGDTIGQTIENMYNTVYTLEDPDVELGDIYSASFIDTQLPYVEKIEILKDVTSSLIQVLSRGKTSQAKELLKQLKLEKAEISKLQYIKLRKDGNGEVLPDSEQSREALQNKLISLYKGVFTNPKVLKEVMTPIDFDYIKKDITTLFKDPETKPDLHHFDSVKQIDLKYDFLAGKAGVGQTANMLVDHVRGMFIESGLNNVDLERGNSKDGAVIFDREFSESLKPKEVEYISKKLGMKPESVKKYKISNSISAFLNAFVDIAKDPYVTRGNWTTQTSNTGFMMLRAGIHPFIVNRFIGQPIIREYIDFIVNAESKFINDRSDSQTSFLESKGIKANKINTKGVLKNDLMWFDKAIKSNNDNQQAQIILKFFELQELSKELVKSINASKPDVSGAGKDLSSRFITENSIKLLNARKYEPRAFNAFDDKLIDPMTRESTILGHYVRNSIQWVDNILKSNPKLFLMAHENVEKVFNKVSYQLRYEPLTSQKLADKLYKDFYTYIMSGFHGLYTDSAPKKLFVDFVPEVINAKLEYPDNFFLQQLEIVNDGLDYIRLQNKKRSKNLQNKLYRGWKALMDSEPELAENLIRYSFYQSGFQNNINEFFSHIPHEYFVENRLNQYIHEVSSELSGYGLYEFINQFIRHNADDTFIVPKLPIHKGEIMYHADDVNVFTFETSEYKRKPPLYVTFDGNLAKLIYNEYYEIDGTGRYKFIYMNKISKKDTQGAVHEYNYNNKIYKSKFKSNNIIDEQDSQYEDAAQFPILDIIDSEEIENVDIIAQKASDNFTEEANSITMIEGVPITKFTEGKALKLMKRLSKQYGIESVLKDLGPASYGEFDRVKNQIAFNPNTYFDKGYIYKTTMFHEYLHPFVKILETANPKLYESIYQEAFKLSETNKYFDVSHYDADSRKEELIVRLLDRISEKDSRSSRSLLSRFLEWLSSFFYENRVNDKATLRKLSPDTTIEELYDVFKNYGNLKQDLDDSIKVNEIQLEIDKVKAIINHPNVPQVIKDNNKKELEILEKALSDLNSYQKLDYSFKSLDILTSDRAKQVFAKGKKNNWDLNKILTELQVPKNIKDIISSKGLTSRDEIVTSLLADNSFVVEVNTARQKGNNQISKRYKNYLNDGGVWINTDTYTNVVGEELENLKKEIAKQNIPTDYYSNLTVPGGTNYTENEITTPDITPNIKGHAQFSTDQGIGWFRSDERSTKEDRIGALQNTLNQLREDKDNPFDVGQGDDIDERIQSLEKQIERESLLNFGNTKTRRILEVQSDLFQKGRGSEELVNTGNETITTNVDVWNDIYADALEEGLTKEQAEEKANKESYNLEGQNQFLQLLNKKNNWVTFFVKSIIQDSVKKGYEKVLFPKRDTAAKIEGHQTLEEFKIQKEQGIKNAKAELKQIKNKGNNTKQELSIIEGIEKQIETFKKELADVESGKTQLSSIANFYETTITNVLKKNGFNPVTITDEYGNKWNQVEITEDMKDQIIYIDAKGGVSKSAIKVSELSKYDDSITSKLFDLNNKC